MNIAPHFFAGALGLGGPEVLLIFAVLLLLFGGSKLPELAKGLGKSIKEFKHAARDEPDAAPVERAIPAATPAPTAAAPSAVTEPAKPTPAPNQQPR